MSARFSPLHRGGTGAPLVCLHGFTDVAVVGARADDGVGHCPQLDAPLETAQLILGFTGR